jgi:pimeloyl-ACP methyl ester carboxylesterase
MRVQRALGVVALAVALVGCASSSTPEAPPGTDAASPSVSAAAGRSVSFTATDGIRLSGRIYGAGTTAVVLSNMGDNDPARWEAFAPKLAERGYLVMTYSYRYPANVGTFTSDMARHTVDDLRGAVAQLRAAGARSIVLAGGSLGGMATAKVAVSERAAAMVVLSAPVDLSDYDFHVLPAELRGTMPKLFIAAQDDTVVPYAETQRMHALAADPKELQPYPGKEHALHLFDGEHASELTERLLSFIAAHAPANA